MTRLMLETGLVLGAIILMLEAAHYRGALLEANIDRKSAWHTVVELRRELESCPPCAARGRAALSATGGRAQ
jgi:hypothetical protein